MACASVLIPFDDGLAVPVGYVSNSICPRGPPLAQHLRRVIFFGPTQQQQDHKRSARRELMIVLRSCPQHSMATSLRIAGHAAHTDSNLARQVDFLSGGAVCLLSSPGVWIVNSKVQHKHPALDWPQYVEDTDPNHSCKRHEHACGHLQAAREPVYCRASAGPPGFHRMHRSHQVCRRHYDCQPSEALCNFVLGHPLLSRAAGR